MRRAALASLLVVCAVPIARAQTDRAARFLDNCQRNDRRRARFCETRNVTLAALRSLTVDGRENGGVTVRGSDRNDIQVVAMIQAEAETDADAVAIAKQVAIDSNGGSIGASGPARNDGQSWSVSYEVLVPRTTDLSLLARNGGLSVEGVSSQMDLETTNGGINLTDVDGNVRGITSNGGVTVSLSGDRWRGTGLDVRTTNGGVHLNVPANYSAMLETGTVNGHLDVGFPITVQGSLDRRISTRLGAGGATIRATTTNGGVSVRRR